MHTITLVVDNTTYYLNSTTDPLELTKRARKPYKPKKPKDIRKFPVRSDLSTAEYVRQFDALNFLQPVQYWPELNTIGTAQYDPSIPLFEILTDEVAA
ncbi:hypothetical protein UFOVP169_24 [uncultured Caudovirales phage]|uniref:Uncharacterized protein n=1 Tax=uncultured Caudovirales phage TaxID=2100421 RepID=A0A6J7WAQ9_9CAUD|nr:hypothetical protein UFOVP169_24 [uncultured Caudovirales phage]